MRSFHHAALVAALLLPCLLGACSGTPVASSSADSGQLAVAAQPAPSASSGLPTITAADLQAADTDAAALLQGALAISTVAEMTGALPPEVVAGIEAAKIAQPLAHSAAQAIIIGLAGAQSTSVGTVQAQAVATSLVGVATAGLRAYQLLGQTPPPVAASTQALIAATSPASSASP